MLEATVSFSGEMNIIVGLEGSNFWRENAGERGIGEENGVSDLSSLPESCISEIISLTSLTDACRATAISSAFKSAADSDTVWEKFLPSDYTEILSRSVTPVVYSTKKELYFRLCDTPILLDGGNLSFILNKWSGKKCYMIRARGLSIVWGDTPQYWRWTSLPESRFSEVAELQAVCWLAIGGMMQTQMLSPKTIYAAYLVFKIGEKNFGLAVQSKASVRFVEESHEGAEVLNNTVYLELPERIGGLRRRVSRLPTGWRPQRRVDGWMEIKLGEFFNDHGDYGEVEMQFNEIKHGHWKSGLIVEGIELRPKE
ncbi:unnamed protein product [Ilex paraguariensis]|uniref:F-box domain-containing protein n=1 Tax=Ilex paraguariensis TaxID=185542 RepID=A0ABC8RD36_9AQUA